MVVQNGQSELRVRKRFFRVSAEAVSAFPSGGEPRLAVVASRDVSHRGFRIRGKLCRVHGCGKDESGGRMADADVAARNAMTGIEDMIEGKPPHFRGRTPAGAKRRVAGEEP